MQQARAQADSSQSLQVSPGRGCADLGGRSYTLVRLCHVVSAEFSQVHSTDVGEARVLVWQCPPVRELDTPPRCAGPPHHFGLSVLLSP